MCICYANPKSFNLLNLKSDKVIPLFPHDLSNSPCIVSLTEKEFLLVTISTQGFGMGVFINDRGEPIKGTLQWPNSPTAVVFQDPWIISIIQNATVQIHDINTLSLIQSIPVPCRNSLTYLKVTNYPFSTDGGRNLISLIIGTPSEIFGLRSVPWEEQLTELLEKNKINEVESLLETLKVQENIQVYYLKGLNLDSD
jgi:hypothetical protein